MTAKYKVPEPFHCIHRCKTSISKLQSTARLRPRWQHLHPSCPTARQQRLNCASIWFCLQVGKLSAAAGEGADYLAQAKLAQLGKQWGVAEAVLLAQGRSDEAIQMYIQAYRWEDAIK